MSGKENQQADSRPADQAADRSESTRAESQPLSDLVPLAQGQPPAIDPALLSACIHCGICLPACPTYLATGRETESPRGRIYLMNLWQQGDQELSPRLAEHLESCLGCFGCQTACPSGVQYEKILNQARPQLAEIRPPGLRRLMRFAFAQILPDYRRLQMLGKLLRVWQSAGGEKLFSALPWLGKTGATLIGSLRSWQSFLPPVPEHVPLPRQSWLTGKKRGQVQLFSGCVMDILYNQVNHACLRLLTAQRNIVQVPDQTCCGALAFHAGETDIACELAKRNIELFQSQSGQIVATAAGCGAMLKSYGELLEKDAVWSQRAREFAARVVDLTEILSQGQFSQRPRPLAIKVAYHAACHLIHAQRIREAPAELLSRLEGISIIPLVEGEHCCGSAGIFNLTHTELSLKVLERKMEKIKESGADTVVTTNPGCMLQLEAGARAAGLKLRVLHLAEILDQAYCQPQADSD